jgi:hypothetical protein
MEILERLLGQATLFCCKGVCINGVGDFSTEIKPDFGDIGGDVPVGDCLSTFLGMVLLKGYIT